MQHQTSPLNGNFGIVIEDVARSDLGDPDFQRAAYDLWTLHGGLLAVRGEDLAATAPQELMDWSRVFGAIEEGKLDANLLERFRKLAQEEARNTESIAERRARGRRFGKMVKEVVRDKRAKGKE